jgi:hypothetical protein
VTGDLEGADTDTVGFAAPNDSGTVVLRVAVAAEDFLPAYDEVAVSIFLESIALQVSGDVSSGPGLPVVLTASVDVGDLRPRPDVRHGPGSSGSATSRQVGQC